MIIVSRPIPFKFVKEVCEGNLVIWFCVPDYNDYNFATIQMSPILRDFQHERTPHKVMSMLCELLRGPHDSETEHRFRRLAAAVDYRHEDTRRHQHVRGAIQLTVENMRPEEPRSRLRMRTVPEHEHASVPHAWPWFLRALLGAPTVFPRSCLAASVHQRTSPRRETPLEIPSDEDIAQTMRAEAAATSSNANFQDDDEVDAVSEPELEIDGTPTEAETDEEFLQDLDENKDQDEFAERRPVLLEGRTLITDPTFTQARLSMQVPYFVDAEPARCIDPKAVCVVHTHELHHCALYLQDVDSQPQLAMDNGQPCSTRL